MQECAKPRMLSSVLYIASPTPGPLNVNTCTHLTHAQGRYLEIGVPSALGTAKGTAKGN